MNPLRKADAALRNQEGWSSIGLTRLDMIALLAGSLAFGVIAGLVGMGVV